MKSTRAASWASAAALLSAVACGTAQPAAHPAAIGRGNRPVSAHAVSARPASGCPVRHAWADAVTATGRVAWQVSLPTDPNISGVTLPPLAVAGEAVFAEENAVYAIRRRDGRRLWRRAFSQQISALTGAVYGLWPGSPGTVVVLSGQVSDDARLTGLSLATGAVRWSLKVPGPGLLGSQAQAGRTLAILRTNGALELVDLTRGRVLWSRHAGVSAGPAAAGTVIAAGSAGRAVGYASRGGRLLWTARRLPQATNLTAVDGLFLAWSNDIGEGISTAVTALNPQTGRVRWMFNPGTPVTILGGGPAGIAFATYSPRRIYLVNPATGKVRWSVGAFVLAEDGVPGQLIETGTEVILPQANTGGPPGDYPIVARSAAGGRVLWSVPLGSDGSAGVHLALLPMASGKAVAVTMTLGIAPDARARMTVYQLATGRRLASAVLPSSPGPLTVAGSSVLAQPDYPSCSVASNGTATGVGG